MLSTRTFKRVLPSPSGAVLTTARVATEVAFTRARRLVRRDGSASVRAGQSAQPRPGGPEPDRLDRARSYGAADRFEAAQPQAPLDPRPHVRHR